MDDSSILQLLILILLVIFSAFFSATETAFSSFNRIRLKNMANDGNKRAQSTLKMSEKFDRVLSTILIGNNMVNIIATAVATIFFIRLCKNQQALGTTIATIVVTVAILIFGEITPKTLAKESPEKFAMFATPFLKFFIVLLYPLNLFFMGWNKLIHLVFKTKEDKTVTEEELLTIVEEAETEGEMQSNEVELIRNAIEFNDIEVKDILRPRVDVVAISEDTSWDEIDNLFRETAYSRLPVFKESIDDIYGVVNQKDFYMAKYRNLKAITTPIEIVVPTMKISELLVLLQKNKAHMAAVVDEYGGIDGIVTMEDVIEELVGEIWDEHDEVIEEFVKISDNEYLVKCSAPLDELFEKFGIDEEIDIPTVSGWVLEELKYLPEEGDSFDYQNLSVTVTKCDERHAIEIKVIIKEEPDEENTESDQE